MPGAEVLAEPLRSRWSPSIYDAEHRLTRDELTALLTAGQWAPSSGNMQPWRFLVAERGDAAHQVLVPHLSRGNSRWVPRASVVLLIAAQVAAEDPEDAFPHATYGPFNTGQAAAHVTLQARAMGLHAHQFMGFDRAAVAAELGVPDRFALLCGIAVGVRGNPEEVSERDRGREEKERVRRPLAEIAFTGRWGEPWA
jgi:nitroreductase